MLPYIFDYYILFVNSVCIVLNKFGKDIFRKHKRTVDIMGLKRGEIFFAELNPVQGSEQGGIRPVLVVQNDVGNSYSPTTIVLPITSRLTKAKLPTHVELSKNESGLARDSVVLAEQIRTIDKHRLQQKISSLNSDSMNKINQAMGISMGINNNI